MSALEFVACIAVFLSIVLLLDRRSLIKELRKTRKEVKRLRRRLDEHPKAFRRHSISQHLRQRVISRCDQTCQYCGRHGGDELDPDGKRWHIDHVIPVAKGGPTHDGNLTLACQQCNLSKSSREPIFMPLVTPVNLAVESTTMPEMPRIESRRQPTPAEAEAIRDYYLLTESKTKTCMTFYGYKNGDCWEWVEMALKGEL